MGQRHIYLRLQFAFRSHNRPLSSLLPYPRTRVIGIHLNVTQNSFLCISFGRQKYPCAKVQVEARLNFHLRLWAQRDCWISVPTQKHISSGRTFVENPPTSSSRSTLDTRSRNAGACTSGISGARDHSFHTRVCHQDRQTMYVGHAMLEHSYRQLVEPSTLNSFDVPYYNMLTTSSGMSSTTRDEGRVC
jgi:hypothetical protein